MQHDGKFYIKLGLPSGTSFPTDPAPEEGDVFYREDEDKVYAYDGVDWNHIGKGVPATDVINVPAGGIAATDVQAALNELDTEKRAIADGLVFVCADKDSDGDYDPLTAVAWEGPTVSGAGTINMNTVFGVPATAKAVALSLRGQDNVVATGFTLKAKSTTANVSVQLPINVADWPWVTHGIVPIASDGTIYYDFGAATFTFFFLRVVGWYI